MIEQQNQMQTTGYREGSEGLYPSGGVAVMPTRTSPSLPLTEETAPKESKAALCGKYLYCIIRCSDERIFNDVVAIGNPRIPVRTVHYDTLAAVVSDSPSEKYESTRSNLLAHERLVESVMREFSVLPVRFGTVATGTTPKEDIQKLLQVRSQEFNKLFVDIEDKVELDLKAFWRDEKPVFEEILSNHQTIRRLRDSLQGKPPQTTHYDRIRLGGMVKEALDRKRSAKATAILAPLRQIARRWVENSILVDRMIVNSAFLVDKSQEEEFDLAVSKLDRELSEQVIFKYVGPVPPYNFVNIVVNWEEVAKE